MGMGHRFHRELLIEELEGRVAPAALPLVMNAANSVYRYMDGDGDMVKLAFSGPGEAVIMDASGMAPNGTDIISIVFSGVTSRTNFSMTDTDPRIGPNTLTAGGDSVETGEEESLGAFKMIARDGTVENTAVFIGRDLSTFFIVGDYSKCYLYVGGNLGNGKIDGNAEGSVIEIVGSADRIQVTGDMVDSVVFANGSISRVLIDGSIVGQGATAARAPGIGGAGIGVEGNVDVCRIGGDLLGAQIVVFGDMKTFSVGGDMIESWVMVGGGFGKGADVKIPLFLGGNVDSFTVEGAAVFSQIGVGGDVGSMELNDLLLFTMIDINGDVAQFRAMGGQGPSLLLIHGNAGDMLFQGGSDGVNLWVDGDVDKCHFKDTFLNCNVDVTGDVSTFLIDGAMAEASLIHVSGETGFFHVKQGITGNSVLDLTGTVDTLKIGAGEDGTSVATGSLVLLGLDLTGKLDVTGDMPGTIDIARSARNADIVIHGNLTGNLLAAAFGDVTIFGAFDGAGQIGDADTTIGFGNTLRITVPGGTGLVVPYPWAFATYIGYEHPVT